MHTDNKSRQTAEEHSAGRSEDAEQVQWDILKEKPNDFHALYNIGVIHFNRGEANVAVECFHKALAVNNTSSEAYNFLGYAHASLGDLDDAIAAYRQAISLQPNNSDFYSNLAIAMLRLENYDEAVEAFRKAVSFNPKLFLPYYNLGLALQRQNKLDDAIEAYKQAIALHPAFPEAYCNLGLAFMAKGRKEEAVDAYKHAIALRPNFPEAFNNLGQPLYELGRMEEASEAYRRATFLRPAYTSAFINLARTLRMRGMLTEAMTACRAGLAVDPNNVEAQIELIALRRRICDWSSAADDLRQLFVFIQEADPFLVATSPSTVSEQMFCAKTRSAKIYRGTPFTHNRSGHSGRMRIGYLSADTHSYQTACLAEELFERHDRSRFEIFGYSYGLGSRSSSRQKPFRRFDHFADFSSTPDSEAAQCIHKDKVDILVDLEGYSLNARTGILANRPAPVQVNYIGYPGTMGADFIDYVIGDSVVTPMEHQPYYFEKIAQLPHCFLPFDTKSQVSGPSPTKASCGLPEQGFVFSCFDTEDKLSAPLFDVWMRLLQAVPQSVLWLLAPNPDVQANLRREAAARSVDPQRLIFATLLERAAHLSRIKLADLVLDTLPYGAHTTAGDSLWAGVPFLTCTGETFAGRVGSSVLRAIGLPELVTTSVDQYKSRALQIATQPHMLSGLKQKLVQNLQTAPLFDMNRTTRDLETAFTRMWNTWQSGNPSQAFALDDK